MTTPSEEDIQFFLKVKHNSTLVVVVAGLVWGFTLLASLPLAIAWVMESESRRADDDDEAVLALRRKRNSGTFATIYVVLILLIFGFQVGTLSYLGTFADKQRVAASQSLNTPVNLGKLFLSLETLVLVLVVVWLMLIVELTVHLSRQGRIRLRKRIQAALYWLHDNVWSVSLTIWAWVKALLYCKCYKFLSYPANRPRFDLLRQL